MVDYRIRTFLTLYEVLNYRRTGELLRLSQPAVSQQIHALEREYGCALFRYDGRRLHPTPQAHQVAEYARAALYNEDRLRQALAAPAPAVIRVGATLTIGEYVLGEPLSRYLRGGGTDLEITVDNTQRLLALLDHDALDFALVEGAFDRSRYGHQLYRKTRFVGLCRRGHPFAGRTLAPEELAGTCAVLREEGSGTRAILERALGERGYSLSLFSRVVCANSFALITRFVSDGVGVTFAYEPVSRDRPDLDCFHLDCLAEAREFHVVYLKGTQVLPLVRSVLGEAEGGG